MRAKVTTCASTNHQVNSITESCRIPLKHRTDNNLRAVIKANVTNYTYRNSPKSWMDWISHTVDSSSCWLVSGQIWEGAKFNEPVSGSQKGKNNLSLCCLMTLSLSKGIWCHVWPYTLFLCLQLTRSDIRPCAIRTVSLVIADDRLIFRQYVGMLPKTDMRRSLLSFFDVA